MAKTKEVSYSELDAFRQCPLKHELGYKYRYRGEVTSPALQKGSLFHKVMEVHYGNLREQDKKLGTKDARNSRSLAEAREAVHDAKLLFHPDTGEVSEIQELVQWMYDGYCECHGTDSDWDILAVEMKLVEWLPTETGHRSSFRLKGTMDLVVRDYSAGGGLWIVDHKTSANMPKGKDFDWEDQFALYQYLAQRRGANIRGLVHNACRTKKLVRPMEMDERFKRTITVRTQTELQRIAAEALDDFRAAYKPRDRQAPRHPDSERCGWRCDFTEPCLGARGGRDVHELLADHGFHVDLERH